MILENKKLESTLLLTLLLPQEHLSCLSYLVRFFNTVSQHYVENKMNSSNLAIVVGPTFIPLQDKSSLIAQNRISKTCDLVKLLIENANKVGIIPNYIIDQVASINEETVNVPNNEKKKKRRSGSLTRMLNGFKKMVGNNKSDEILPEVPSEVTPDLLITPIINGSVKKRKVDRNALYTKKKKELLEHLPQACLLNTPFTPVATPMHRANQKTEKIKKEEAKTAKNNQPKEKKHQWYSRNKTSKNLKSEDRTNSKSSLGTKSLLERRWSVVSHANVFRKNKKRYSYAGTPLRDLISKSEPTLPNKTNEHVTADEPSALSDTTDPDYVRLPKSEYEQIKTRMAEIERKLSLEMETAQAIKNDELKSNDNVKNVQTAYEQTLEQAEPLSPTTDHLARRLSRELKIRRSIGDRIIRSPSARKIGTIRRRSRELVKHNTSISRNKSWHSYSDIKIPRVTLQRNKDIENIEPISPIINMELSNDNKIETSTSKMVLRSSLNRTNSVTSFEDSIQAHISASQNLNDSDNWVNGESFFSASSNPCSAKIPNNRPSVAKLRSQNAGMVLAKAKLFDNLDVESQPTPRQSIRPNSKVTLKVGLSKNSELRMSQRIRALKLEDRSCRKSVSPRRKLDSHKQKLNIARQQINTNEAGSQNFSTPNASIKIVSTPKRSPVIKKALLQRSPKRLLRTPNHLSRNTPLKIVATPGLI